MYSISPSPSNQTQHCFVDGVAEIFLRITIPVINSPSPPFARSPLSSSSVRESQVSTLWILHAILWLQQRNIDDTTSDRHLSGPMVLFPYSLLFVLPPTLSLLNFFHSNPSEAQEQILFYHSFRYRMCHRLFILSLYMSVKPILQLSDKVTAALQKGFIFKIQSLALLIRGQ